jgi:hypothetical protein
MLDSVKNDRSRDLLMRPTNAWPTGGVAWPRDDAALGGVAVVVVVADVAVVRSFYPNLVKDKTAPASADAEPDARALHAVRQPIQAFHQPLNKLTDDAIIQARREKTVNLSVQQQVGASMQDVQLLMLHWVWA